jgi:hypothetical protein
MERELSQLAARGMTKDGWMILMPVGLATRCGLGQSALRGRIWFWTDGGRAQALAVRQHPDTLCLAYFRFSRGDERRAKIILQ